MEKANKVLEGAVVKIYNREKYSNNKANKVLGSTMANFCHREKYGNNQEEMK